MKLKKVADFLLEEEQPFFEYLTKRANQLGEAYTKGAWLEKNSLDNAISCQDVWSNWIFDFLKDHGIVVKDYESALPQEDKDTWDFVVEIVGQVILWPVFEFYINGQGKENVFSDDLVKIWNFGDMPDLTDFRKAFHDEYTSLIKRWKEER